MLYMQIVWYWAGKNEKTTHKDHAHLTAMYNTKEMSFALVLAIVVIALLSVQQAMAPLDYNTSDLGIRIAPLIFLVLAIFGTLKIQELMIDDHYGTDAIKPVSNSGSPLEGLDLIIYNATRITGGKLTVSLLLLIFGTLFVFNLVGEYLRGLRAYADKLPERAWQYDVATKYTVGTGFLPVTVTSL